MDNEYIEMLRGLTDKLEEQAYAARRVAKAVHEAEKAGSTFFANLHRQEFRVARRNLLSLKAQMVAILRKQDTLTL